MEDFRTFVEFDEAQPAALSAAAVAAAPCLAPASLLGRIPLLAWVLLGCVVLFAVSFYVYYTRRKGGQKARDAEEIEALRKQLAEAREDIDALIQQHSAMAGTLRSTTTQLRGVNDLARSVEQGLAEALDSWSQTVQELRGEFEMVAEEEEQQQQHEQQHEQHEQQADRVDQADGQELLG